MSTTPNGKELLSSYFAQSSNHLSNFTGLVGTLGKIMSALYSASDQEDEALFGQKFQELTLLIDEIYSGKHPQMINATLDNGLAGLGLALHCLIEDGLIENDLEPLLTDIDAFVYRGAKKFFLQSNHALGTGGQGGLHYLSLRQAKNPTAKKYVTDLMKKLKINDKYND